MNEGRFGKTVCLRISVVFCCTLLRTSSVIEAWWLDAESAFSAPLFPQILTKLNVLLTHRDLMIPS